MAVSQAEIQSPGASKNPKLKAVPDVDIDKNGKFKYILIKVHDPSKEREFKHIVRGTAKAAFHGRYYFFNFRKFRNRIVETQIYCIFRNFSTFHILDW